MSSRVYMGYDALVAVAVVSVLTTVGRVGWSRGRTSSLAAPGGVSTPSQQPPCTSHSTTTCQPHRKPSHVYLASAKGATAKSSKSQCPLGVPLRACRIQPDISFTWLESFTELAATFLSLLPQASPWFTTKAPCLCYTNVSTTITSSSVLIKRKNSCSPVRVNVSHPKDDFLLWLFTLLAKEAKQNSFFLLPHHLKIWPRSSGRQRPRRKLPFEMDSSSSRLRHRRMFAWLPEVLTAHSLA